MNNTKPSYNNGTLKHGESYGCGCIVGVYDCYDALLCCGANPKNLKKIRDHRLEILTGPRSNQLDYSMFIAKEGDEHQYAEPTGCSCHLNPPCSYCTSNCFDCEEHVDDCKCSD